MTTEFVGFKKIVLRPDIRGPAIKAMVEALKDHPCMDCGGQFQPEAMDWDHRPEETKLWNVGEMVSGRYAWEANALFKKTCEHDDEPKLAHVKKDRPPKPPRDRNMGGRRKGGGGYFVGHDRRAP